MRKRIITPTPETIRSRGQGWLDVERAALVEITLEEPDYPIEGVFASGQTRGWRAATTGSQTIRLVFEQPQRLKRITLICEENEQPRTQEFALRWSSNGGTSFMRLCANSGISVLLRPEEKSKNIRLSFQTLRYSN